VDYAYARVSTTTQDLTRQIDALQAAGIAEVLIWTEGDRRKCASPRPDRPSTAYPAGHRISVVTLDRLGRNMRECLNLAYELTERGITIADKIPADTSAAGP
jgi:DNA invertase Pin-like site-specific DNA recombinase